MPDQTYRLVTRSDFDGLVCAVLLRSLGMIDTIDFVHPKDVQDGLVEVTGRDILTNLPYSPNAHLVFDHHHSETLRTPAGAANHVIDAAAKSAARVVYDYYGGAGRFPGISDELMRAVDQADSADYGLDDIVDPKDWTLLNYLMDSRTGLGRFRDFRISNYQLMMQLIDDVLAHDDVKAILRTPDVAERVALYATQVPLFVEQLHRVSHTRGDLVVVDLRTEEVIHAGNRFMIYALYPAVPGLGAPDLGEAAAEHRDRLRKVDHRPDLSRRSGRPDAPVRRRRPPQRRDVPGRARPRRRRPRPDRRRRERPRPPGPDGLIRGAARGAAPSSRRSSRPSRGGRRGWRRRGCRRNGPPR